MNHLNQKNPVISVIIPAYNEEKLLPRCLESLKKQKFEPPFEVIVVDGDSQDQTAEIARRFGAKLINQKGKGIGDARWLGCRKAEGEIIANTDADVILPPYWLRKIVTYFEKHPRVGALVGGVSLTNNSRLLLKLLFGLGPLAWGSVALLAGHPLFTGRNSAIRKETYEKAGGFDRRLNCQEDTELSLRVGRVTKIAYLPSLKVRTTDRRWRSGYLQYLFTKLAPAFWYNVILKRPLKKYNRWERVD